MKKFPESELILNPDGSVYHIKLHPEQLANTIIVVGDQHRVEQISTYFDRIDFKVQNREFVTHTGEYRGKRITALSTGIGTDNIDIVINELDALVNIDLKNRISKNDLTSLNIIRIGTSGALQSDIPVDSFVMSSHGLGFDGLLNFYKPQLNIFESAIADAFIKHANWNKDLAKPYVVKASDELVLKLGKGLTQGITATACGFYGPQGRELRIPLAIPDLNEKIETFRINEKRITNFEMETSALYGLCAVLGHKALTICDIIANRQTKQYSKNYKKSVDQLIQLVLERLSS